MNMIRPIRKAGRRYAHDPARRGYHAVYREQEKNFCPGCGRTHWWLGRFSAECVSCGTALLYADVRFTGGSIHVRTAASGGQLQDLWSV